MNQPLRITAESDQLVIRIGVSTLAHAIASGDKFHSFNGRAGKYLRTFAITDAPAFVSEVVRAMQSEAEDGSTPLSDFLDRMAQDAIDDGATGVEYEQRIEYGEKSPKEVW